MHLKLKLKIQCKDEVVNCSNNFLFPDVLIINLFPLIFFSLFSFQLSKISILFFRPQFTTICMLPMSINRCTWRIIKRFNLKKLENDIAEMRLSRLVQNQTSVCSRFESIINTDLKICNILSHLTISKSGHVWTKKPAADNQSKSTRNCGDK